MSWELDRHMHSYLDATIRYFINERTVSYNGCTNCFCENFCGQNYNEVIDLLVTVCSSHLWEEGECFASIKESIKDGTRFRFGFMDTKNSECQFHKQWIVDQLISIVVDNAIETGTTNNGGHLVYLDKHGDWKAPWVTEEQ